MDVGEELTSEAIDSLVEDNYGVNCFLFLGEGNDLKALLGLAGHVRSIGLKVALYSGRQEVEDEIYRAFDYVKVGPYMAKFGPLNESTTNQRLYRISHEGKSFTKTDITSRFWHRGIDPNASH